MRTTKAERRLLLSTFLYIFAAAGIFFVGYVYIPTGAYQDWMAIPSFIYAFAVLVSASVGFERAGEWEGPMGGGLRLLSCSLVAWAAGSLALTTYGALFNAPAPDPWLDDAGFAGAILLAGAGQLRILKTVKARPSGRDALAVLALSVLIFAAAYLLFLHEVAASDMDALQKALGLLYPFGDAVLLALAAVALFPQSTLSKPLKMLAAGFAIKTAADAALAWAVSLKLYYTGSWPDMLFAAAFFTLGLALFSFRSRTRARS